MMEDLSITGDGNLSDCARFPHVLNFSLEANWNGSAYSNKY